MLNDLERTCLAGHRSGRGMGKPPGDDVERWIRFGMHQLLDVGRSIRARRSQPVGEDVNIKPDGSLDYSDELLADLRSSAA